MKFFKSFLFWGAPKYVAFYNHFFVKFILSPLLFTLPYLLIGLYANTKVQDSLKKTLGSQNIESLLDTKLWLFYALIVLASLLWSKLYEIADYINGRGVFTDVKKASFNAVWDKLVQSKSTRFIEFATSSQYRASNKETIFSTITRPDQQLLVLAKVLQKYLVEQYKTDFKVRIIGIENDKPTQWLAAEPEQPETQPNQLSESDSTISHCLKKKKLVIIESISDELKKPKRHYMATHEDDKDDSGSLICIPCPCQVKKTITSIVVIWCKKDSFFTIRERDRIQSIAEQIRVRVQLEQCLAILRA